MTPANFRRIRRRLGLTQSGAASVLHASERTIRAYEAGARDVPDLTAVLWRAAERDPAVLDMLRVPA